MIIVKKAIPSLAIGGAMALTGCGDSGGGNSGSLSNAINSLCMKAAECNYDMGQCVSLLQMEEVPSECVGDAISYLSCVEGLSCTDLMSWVNDEFDGCENRLSANCRDDE